MVRFRPKPPGWALTRVCLEFFVVIIKVVSYIYNVGKWLFVNKKIDLAIDIGGLYLVDFLKKEPVVIDDENEISDMTDYVISFDSLQKMITFLGIKMIRLYAK